MERAELLFEGPRLRPGHRTDAVQDIVDGHPDSAPFLALPQSDDGIDNKDLVINGVSEDAGQGGKNQAESIFGKRSALGVRGAA